MKYTLRPSEYDNIPAATELLGALKKLYFAGSVYFDIKNIYAQSLLRDTKHIILRAEGKE